MSICGNLEGLRAASLYGELTPAEWKILQDHLDACEACRREDEELKAVLDLFPPQKRKLPAGDRDRSIRLILGRTRRSPLPWIAAAAAVLLAAVVLWPREAPLVPAPAVAERPTPKPAPEIRPEPPPPKPVPPAPPPAPPPLKRVEPPAPAPEVVEPEPPAPPPPPAPRPTVAAIARFETSTGTKDVFPGDTLALRGRVLYGDATEIVLGPDCSVRDETGPGGKRLILLQGEVRARVSKQPAGQPLRIVSGDAVAVILGTALRVARRDDVLRLEVHEGRVRLEQGDQSVDVPAGRYIEARPGHPASLRSLRATLGLAALYTFSEGAGRRVHDRSGASPPLDLSIGSPGRTLWGPDGLSVNGTPLIATDGPATRLIEACRTSNAITLEAWIRPAKPMLGFDGAILALSSDNADRNFALVQGQNENGSSAYEASLRTSTTNPGGDKPLASPRRLLEPGLTHVVFTRSSAGTERLFVNGVERSSRTRPGGFATWNPSFRLELGDERTQERPWSGTYRLLAVYSRALGTAEVARNFNVGADGW